MLNKRVVALKLMKFIGVCPVMLIVVLTVVIALVVVLYALYRHHVLVMAALNQENASLPSSWPFFNLNVPQPMSAQCCEVDEEEEEEEDEDEDEDENEEN